MSVHGYTKNYKLIKPKFDADTWHDHEYDNLDTIDAVLSAIYASGNWQGFWQKNTNYNAGSVIIDKDTDTMYKVMVDHTTSEADFATEYANNPTYYELWSPNNLAESWATDTTGLISNTDYSSKAYAISSGLIDEGSSKEWAVGTGTIGNTNLYSAKKYADDAHSDYISMTTDANVAAVGSNIASVNTVAGISSAVSTVANKATEVDTVAWISNDVTTVAGVATAVSNVSNIQAAVLNVSDDRANVNLVAQNINNVNNVGNDITNVNKVGNDITNVDTVANNISNVNTAAANMTAIQNAPTAASNAASSATASANSASASANYAEWSRQYANDKINQTHITNCITEIPQDIKLELSNGTLTLKAGSKLYYPNGLDSNNNPKFTIRVTTEDYVANGQYGFDATPHILCLDYANYWVTPDAALVFSGATAPTAGYQYMLWYDTANNIVKWTSDSGSTWITEDCSLPLGIATYNGGSYANGFKQIDQTFNGFSEIGSTAFALPGVKGLIPNGRNADGTLKNIECVTSKVTIRTWTYQSENQPLFIMANGLDMPNAGFYYISDTELLAPTNPWIMWYNPTENIMRYSNNDNKWTIVNDWLFTGIYTSSDTEANNYRLTKFTQPKLPFQAVDRNDISWVFKNIPVIGIPSTSGTVTLADNTVYKGTMTGAMTFVLPTVTDKTTYHQIKAMLYLPVVTIDWGTAHYIGGEAPDVSEAGQYMIYWDYIPNLNAWAVGAMKTGA